MFCTKTKRRKRIDEIFNKDAAIAFTFMLTISAILVALPTAVVHDPSLSILIWAYISVTNNPIGVSHQEVIVF